MIHLDTNFLIDALIPASAQEAKLVGWLSAGETIGISAVAWGEFLCGPPSPSAEAAARRLLPGAAALSRADAEHAANSLTSAAAALKVSTIAV
jgi:predicted nucleic acid-binding protein